MNLPLPLSVRNKKHCDALQRLSECVYTRVSGRRATCLEGVKDEMAEMEQSWVTIAESELEFSWQLKQILSRNNETKLWFISSCIPTLRDHK